MLLTVKWVLLSCFLWLFTKELPSTRAQDLCQPRGWRNFECLEVASLQDLVDLGAENWHTLSIRNENTELEVGSGEVSLAVQFPNSYFPKEDQAS